MSKPTYVDMAHHELLVCESICITVKQWLKPKRRQPELIAIKDYSLLIELDESLLLIWILCPLNWYILLCLHRAWLSQFVEFTSTAIQNPSSIIRELPNYAHSLDSGKFVINASRQTVCYLGKYRYLCYYLKVTTICRYIFLRLQCKAYFASTNFCDLYVEMVQGQLILMFVVHIVTVMFVSTKFCVFGPIHKNIKC